MSPSHFPHPVFPSHHSSQGPYIANKRSPRIAEQYAAIGGKSPIRDWTEFQGEQLVSKLSARAPELGPFKHYTLFRYAPPLTHTVLERMKADGVQRAIAFSQYPQFSCTTTGSSLNHLWRESIRLNCENAFKWSLIDRWHSHPGFIEAVARRVALGLQKFAPEDRSKVIILFSAHSVPMMVVNRGDAYVAEVAGTVARVMERLRKGKPIELPQGAVDKVPASAQEAAAAVAAAAPAAAASSSAAPLEQLSASGNSHILAWQSKVGFLPWMGPSTAAVIEGLAAQGHKHVLAVPIAFTSDHIETLFEIGQEYKHLATEKGITHFQSAPSLNEEPLLTEAMADMVVSHLKAGQDCTPEYRLNCAGCTNPACRTILNPASGSYSKQRDAAAVAEGLRPGERKGSLPSWPLEKEVQQLKSRKEPCN